MKTPLHIAGSKIKLVPKIEKLLSDKFNTYVEPFCGSASVFYEICHNFKYNFLYDTSEETIDVHNYIMNVTDEQLENDRIHAIEMWNSYKREKNRVIFDYVNTPLQVIVYQIFVFGHFFTWKKKENKYFRVTSVYESGGYNHGRTVETVLEIICNEIKKIRDSKIKVTIERKSFFDVYESFINNERALVFIDPPYVNGYVSYSGGDFTQYDKDRLTEIINKAKCGIVYTDYENLNLEKHFYGTKLRNAVCNTVKRNYTAPKIEMMYCNFSISKQLF